MAGPNHILDHDQVKTIRHALLLGLASYAEIERLNDVQKTHLMFGQAIHEDLRVLHPTGSAETVAEFAAALRDLEYSISREVRS